MAWWRRHRNSKYHVGEGTIVADDVEIIADHFIGMVAGMPARRASLGVVRSAQDERRRLHLAVALFRRSVVVSRS